MTSSTSPWRSVVSSCGRRVSYATLLQRAGSVCRRNRLTPGLWLTVGRLLTYLAYSAIGVRRSKILCGSLLKDTCTCRWSANWGRPACGLGGAVLLSSRRFEWCTARTPHGPGFGCTNWCGWKVRGIPCLRGSANFLRSFRRKNVVYVRTRFKEHCAGRDAWVGEDSGWLTNCGTVFLHWCGIRRKQGPCTNVEANSTAQSVVEARAYTAPCRHWREVRQVCLKVVYQGYTWNRRSGPKESKWGRLGGSAWTTLRPFWNAGNLLHDPSVSIVSPRRRRAPGIDGRLGTPGAPHSPPHRVRLLCPWPPPPPPLVAFCPHFQAHCASRCDQVAGGRRLTVVTKVDSPLPIRPRSFFLLVWVVGSTVVGRRPPSGHMRQGSLVGWSGGRAKVGAVHDWVGAWLP